MSEAIPLLKTYLNDPNPYVRLSVANDLFIVGDNSGYSALLALVQEKTAIPGLGGGDLDVRIQAAKILGQYRQTNATQAIYNLYQRTKKGELIQVLQILAPNRVGTLIPSTDYYADFSSIRDYEIENDKQFIPKSPQHFLMQMIVR